MPLGQALADVWAVVQLWPKPHVEGSKVISESGKIQSPRLFTGSPFQVVSTS